MQMGHDFENERQSAGPPPRIGYPPASLAGTAGAGAAHPEWTALRARYLAAHALRRAIAAAGPALVPAGSFVAAAGAVLVSCRQEPGDVNLVYSGNRKAGLAISHAVAATPTPGDRGMQ